jgi:hypothetical protein
MEAVNLALEQNKSYYDEDLGVIVSYNITALTSSVPYQYVRLYESETEILGNVGYLPMVSEDLDEISY